MEKGGREEKRQEGRCHRHDKYGREGGLELYALKNTCRNYKLKN